MRNILKLKVVNTIMCDVKFHHCQNVVVVAVGKKEDALS
jgi:hypothetical protein